MLSFLILVGLVAACAFVAEFLFPRMEPAGFGKNAIAGLLGATAGESMFGHFGPAIAGVAIIPALIGASMIIYCLGLFCGPVVRIRF